MQSTDTRALIGRAKQLTAMINSSTCPSTRLCYGAGLDNVTQMSIDCRSWKFDRRTPAAGQRAHTCALLNQTCPHARSRPPVCRSPLPSHLGEFLERHYAPCLMGLLTPNVAATAATAADNAHTKPGPQNVTRTTRTQLNVGTGASSATSTCHVPRVHLAGHAPVNSQIAKILAAPSRANKSTCSGWATT